MKIQLEQLDLVHPWPQLVLRDGYRAIRILVRIGASPIGEVMMRPARKRVVTHRRLRKRIARLYTETILSTLARLGAAAGPQALQWFMPHAWPSFDLARSAPRDRRHFVERYVLQEVGLASPLREWAMLADAPTTLPAVTVAVCTRDRSKSLEILLDQLQRLDYPNFDVLVVDNSADAIPTRAVAERFKVGYVRCRTPGLSRARNAAIEHAHAAWIAFIDDDARPEANWLKELVRGTEDKNCQCICGMMLPAQLENAAAVVRDRYDLRNRSFAAAIFSAPDVSQDRFAGAGANLLVHRPFVQAIGGFDIDLGPGPRALGGGEDIDLLDRVLRHRGNVHLQPRAIVRHDRPTTPKSLRQHVKKRAAGRAILLIRRATFTDRNALLQLFVRTPIALLGEVASGLRGRSPIPFSLTLLELRTLLATPAKYGWHRLVRLFRPRRGSVVVPVKQLTPAPKTSEQKPPINPKLAA